jgi:hypothetical protein
VRYGGHKEFVRVSAAQICTTHRLAAGRWGAGRADAKPGPASSRGTSRARLVSTSRRRSVGGADSAGDSPNHAAYLRRGGPRTVRGGQGQDVYAEEVPAGSDGRSLGGAARPTGGDWPSDRWSRWVTAHRPHQSRGQRAPNDTDPVIASQARPIKRSGCAVWSRIGVTACRG